MRLAAVGRLVGHFHFVEVQPGEGRDRLCVVVQVGDVALGGWDGHVEDQPLLWRLMVFSIQGGGGERGEDELVHLQDEGGHEGGLGRLVLHRTVDQNRQPHRLCLRAGQRDGKMNVKDKVAPFFPKSTSQFYMILKEQCVTFFEDLLAKNGI